MKTKIFIDVDYTSLSTCFIKWNSQILIPSHSTATVLPFVDQILKFSVYNDRILKSLFESIVGFTVYHCYWQVQSAIASINMRCVNILQVEQGSILVDENVTPPCIMICVNIVQVERESIFSRWGCDTLIWLNFNVSLLHRKCFRVEHWISRSCFKTSIIKNIIKYSEQKSESELTNEWPETFSWSA